jgi:polyribonucleotide nucleotidyltransferase
MQILDLMATVLPEPRKELSEYAPKIQMMTINPEKIKDVIGRGGEMITKIILECSPAGVKTVNDKDAVRVDLEDDGRVIVYHTDKDVIAKTMARIEEIVREVETGKVYTGKVVKVEDFGCFVELWPGCEGMVHVSQLAYERVNRPSDLVKVGDEIVVKSLGYDNRGRLNLSRKEALPKPVKKEEVKETKKSE